MNPNVKMVQKQIRSFNKAYSRILNADKLSAEGLALTGDLIEWDRMTKSGFAKAGTKYLENMTEEELLTYSSDIQDAYDIVRWDREMQEFELSAKDPESLLWKMFDVIEEKRELDLNSNDIKDIINGVYEIGYKEVASKMYRVLKDESYGNSDFHEWLQKQKSLS